LYSVASAAWTEIQGAASGGTAVDRNVATFADLATLPDKVDQENVYVADASGDATVDSGWAIYKYVQATTSFVKIAEQESLDQAAGGGPVGKELNVVFDSDLDTVSAQRMFQGAINNLAVVLPDELTALSYEVRLDTTTTWTAQADLTALQSWIDSNVSTATTKWQLRFIATYAASATGEAAALFTYQNA
jgi:hypothetical protein